MSKPQIKRAALAYSGGLDTSIIVPWLREHYGCEVVCYCSDVGQGGEELTGLEAKARAIGASEVIVEDLRVPFVRDFCFPALRAGAVYEGRYLLGTSLARPLIASRQVWAAQRTHSDALAHGCTGKGNDQVRIEATIATLAPELKIIAPVREWQMGRDEEIAYAQEHGIPVSSSVERPYSIDDNLWGRSSEGGIIEDLTAAIPDDVFQLVTPPTKAPDTPEDIIISFRDGLPVSLNEVEMPLHEIIPAIAEHACRNGVGIMDHIEDRVVGLKVRDVYEVPAATVILEAHKELEKLVCTGRQNALKPNLDLLWAQLAYEGLWYEPLMKDLNAFMDHVNRKVEGTVTVRLYKGSATVTTRDSPLALYDRTLATFDADPSFSQNASPGFIELFSLQSRMAHQIEEARDLG